MKRIAIVAVALLLISIGALADLNAPNQPVSGTVTVTQATASSLKVDLSGTGANSTALNTDDMASAATGSAVPANAMMTGGSDGTNLRAIRTDTGGYLQAAPVDGSKASYSAGSASFAPASSATDVCYISGSASKTIRVTAAWLAGTQTTAGTIQAFLIKRSTANSAGTCSSVTAAPNDSSNSAASATVSTCTANPTTGTAVANTRSNKLFIPAPATAAGQPIWDLNFGTRPSQAIVLRGTAQVLAFNLGSTTVTGGALTCGFEWTEE